MKPGEHKTVQARIFEYAETIDWTVAPRKRGKFFDVDAKREHDLILIDYDEPARNIVKEPLIKCLSRPQRVGVECVNLANLKHIRDLPHPPPPISTHGTVLFSGSLRSPMLVPHESLNKELRRRKRLTTQNLRGT